MQDKAVKEKIVKSVEKFNKYRAPEAVAKLLSVSKGSFKIEFTGPFCRSCGFYDYFDDLKIFLGESNLKAEIKEVEETDEGGIVEFAIIVEED